MEGEIGISSGMPIGILSSVASTVEPLTVPRSWNLRMNADLNSSNWSGYALPSGHIDVLPDPDAWNNVRHAPGIAEILQAASAERRKIWTLNDVVSSRGLISPDPTKPFMISFDDMTGVTQPEGCVTVCSNGVNYQACDKRHLGHARPRHDFGFTMIDRLGGSKPHWDQVFGAQGTVDEFLKNAVDWYARRDLVLYGYEIKNDTTGCIHGQALMPVELAVSMMAFDLNHRVLSIEEMTSSSYDPRISTLNPVGLRYSMCRGEQVCFLERIWQDGKPYFISRSVSSYQGLAWSKKKIFHALSWLLHASEAGILLHATMDKAYINIESKGKCIVVTITMARSSHGKTERSYTILCDENDNFTLAEHVDDSSKNVVLNYPKEHRVHVIAAGDDGLILTGDTAQTSEQGGLFERPSGAHKRGDLPYDDAVCDNARWYEQLALGMDVSNGRIESHLHETILGKRNANPRMNYSWEILQRCMGMEVELGASRFQLFNFNIGVSKGMAPWSVFNWIPRKSFFALVVAGFVLEKSKSVNGDQTSIVSEICPDHSDMTFDWAGTMSGFTTLHAWEFANDLYKLMTSGELSHVNCLIVPVGWCGPKYKEVDHRFAMFQRDLFVHREAGTEGCSWEWEPAESVMFGWRPSKVKWFGNTLPEELENPATQIGYGDYCNLADQWHIENVRFLRAMIKKAGDQLNKGALNWLEQFCCMPVRILNTKPQRRLLLAGLNSLDNAPNGLHDCWVS